MGSVSLAAISMRLIVGFFLTALWVKVSLVEAKPKPTDPKEKDPKCGPEETVVFGWGGKSCVKKFLPRLKCDSNAKDQAAECAKQCKKKGDYGGKKCDHLTKCDSGVCNDLKKCDDEEDCEGLGHSTSGLGRRHCIDKGDGKRCHVSDHNGSVWEIITK